MKAVNVYIYNSVKGLKAADAVVGYVLETDMKGRIYTSDGFMYIGEATRDGAELCAMTAALSRLKEKCSLTVYTANDYIKTCLENGWPYKWKKNDWKTSNNKPVKHAQKWREALISFSGNGFSFVVEKGHAYHSWMADFALKNAEKMQKNTGKILCSGDIS